MDLTQMCLLVTLCLTLVSQAVFSAPMAGDVEHIVCGHECDLIQVLTRHRREADSNDENSNDVISRVRRQVAQMAGSRVRYGGRRMRYRGNRGRLHGRRIYNNRRLSKTRGRVVVW